MNPISSTATLAAACAATLLLATVPAARADTVFDNLGSAQDGSDPVLAYGPLADSFTSTTDGWLTGVSALLANGSPDIVGLLRWSLHADAGNNSPGVELAALGTLSSADVGGSFASYSLTPSAAVSLTAGTRYWIEIEAQGPNAVAWSWSADLGAIGVGGEFNYNALLGSSSNASFAPYQMAVAVTPVPEPASALLTALGFATLAAAGRHRKTRARQAP